MTAAFVLFLPAAVFIFATCVSGEHRVDEDTDEGGEDEEMTEEEWSRRVAELNALQVDSLSWNNIINL